MAYKQIQVTEQTHAKIAQIAKANYRGIGDQVAFWADTTCVHPLDQRMEVNVMITFVAASIINKTAQAGNSQLFRGFFCSKCRQYFLNEVSGEKAEQKISMPTLNTARKA